jgi:phage FluMu protein Com
LRFAWWELIQQEETMHPIICAHCGQSSTFDPSQLSPALTKRKRSAGATRKVVIQCPKCKKWLTIEVKDGTPTSDRSKKIDHP